MKKVTRNSAKVEVPVTRMTRAQAKASGSGTSGEALNPSRASFKQQHKRKATSQRVATDDERTSTVVASQHKRRAVLKDVTNVNQKTKIPALTSKQPRRSSVVNNDDQACDAPMKIPLVQQDAKEKPAEGSSRISMVEFQETVPPGIMNQDESRQKSSSSTVGECVVAGTELVTGISGKAPVLPDVHRRGQDRVITDIVDLDSNTKDPQLCSFFVNDMYNNFRISELDQRPSTNYMENVQQDITPIMRGILIDWLVEVSEEYKFVPDTLYLAVNLIDRFLSKNSIGKQKLQLLGVACMFIASKYEEICALGADVFCFLTDNTCPKEEIFMMERQVLNLLHFKLSIPTTKTFLRRFIQAAQASYQVHCVELEFLANYLSELTLVEYTFLKYLPSLVAASAIFLARWILNQSDHPWNRTLEHYTNYMASELKTTVLELDNLQQNVGGCFLHAIREKYKQQKFKCVATLKASRPVQALF